MPATYRVEIDPDVNLQSVITLDVSQNWLEALGQAMVDADIEFITNLYRKSATIKRTKTSLGQAIDQLIPNDYTVFTHAGIDLQTPIHFDTHQFWVDALNRGVDEIGIDLTINFTNKSIYLMPIKNYAGSPPAVTTKQ